MSVRAPFRTSVGALAVAVAALAVYAPALANGFAYDDVAVIQQDERVHSLAGAGRILTSGYWRDADLALYRPLTTLSFAVDWSIAPGEPAWFHLTNLLLHACASVLVLLLLARFFAPTAAFAGALLFAIHPVHVEAVANVVGRAEMLAAVFVLGACLLWTRRVPRAVVAALYALALLAKESAVVLPALLVLVDAASGALRPGTARAWLRSRWRAFAWLALVLVAYLGARAVVLDGIAPVRVDPLLEIAATPGARVLTALQAWPVWLRLLFLPDVLLADYGPQVLAPALTLTAESLFGLVLLVATLAFGGLAWLRGAGLAALVLLWFPVAILPVANLLVPIGVVVAERTLYLPSFALSAALAALVARVARGGLSTRTRRVALAAAAIVALLLGARTVTRIPVWDSTDAVMLALVRDRPDAFRGQWHLARMARAQSDTRGAVARYLRAFELWPYRQNLVMEAARYAAEQGYRRPAYDLSRWAAQQWPAALDAQRLLAGTAIDVSDTATARVAIEAGLDIDPADEVLLRMRAALDSLDTSMPEAP